MPVEDQKVDGQKYQIIPRVLIFAARGGKLLMIKGAPSKRLWPNLYNGIGGHIEPGESILQAARREFLEETGLELLHAQMCAIVTIDTGQYAGIGMFVFRGQAAEGTPRVSPEGTPDWIEIERVQDLPLVEDLPILIPKVLAWQSGSPVIFGHYRYAENNELVINFTQ